MAGLLSESARLSARGESQVLKGHGFSRAVNVDNKRRALAPEEQFSAFSTFTTDCYE
jgi:hypothetical protein